MIFPATRRAEWLQQAEREVKGQSLSSLASLGWPGAIVDPFQDISTSQSIVRLPDQWFQQPPLVTAVMRPGTGETASAFNRRILQALHQGAQVLRIAVDKTTLAQTPVWLTGVETDFIQLQWDVNPLENIPLSSLRTSLPVKSWIVVDWDRADLHEMMAALPVAGFMPLARFTLPLCAPAHDAFIQLFKAIRSFAKTWQTTPASTTRWHDHLVVIQPADDVYYRQVMTSRSVQLVIRQLIEDIGGTGSPCPASPVELAVLRNADEAGEQFLIRASAAAVGAYLTGLGALAMTADETDGTPAHIRRAGLHLHHLLTMESQLMKGEDPLAGAYALDSCTAQWAAAIWNRLQEE